MTSEDPQATRIRAASADASATRIRGSGANAAATLLRPRAGQAYGDASIAPHQGMVLQGHYQLERLIGQGAMGQVWCARDLLSEEAGERNANVAV